MICPKCRTKYPESVSVCPDCGIDLIALLGEADAPADEEWDLKKSRWKSAPEDEMIIPQTVEIYTDRSAEGFEEEEPVTQDEPAEKQPDITLEKKDFSAFERKPAKKISTVNPLDPAILEHVSREKSLREIKRDERISNEAKAIENLLDLHDI